MVLNTCTCSSNIATDGAPMYNTILCSKCLRPTKEFDVNFSEKRPYYVAGAGVYTL